MLTPSNSGKGNRVSKTSSPNALQADAIEANANVLAAAQRSGNRLAGLPGAVAKLEDAYHVQDALVRALGGAGGWKVTPLPPEGQPRCSPIPTSFIRPPSDAWQAPPADSLLVEVEIGIRLGADLRPVEGRVTRDLVAKAIGTVHTAIEIVTSRFAAGLDAPDLDRTADLQCCGGVVLGPGRADWSDFEFADQIAEIAGPAANVRAQTSHPSTARTLDAIAWLAAHAAERGLPLVAGQTIITGARLGPLVLPAERDLIVRAGSFGSIRIAAPE